MGSQGNPQTFVPYDNKDCSQAALCSIYCPQLCPMAYSPPAFGFPDDDSNPTFSPLIIAIIAILASALLLVIYYTFLSKYCGNSRRRRNRNPSEDFNENRNQIQHEAWQTTTTGLAESLIKSLGVCKYKKGDGLIEGTDCAVCLTEFKEGEGLRLLPECNHAFHHSCIDTWLKSHSNCPLCRANIVCSIPLPPIRIVPPVPDNPPENRRLPERRRENDIVVELENLERNRIGETGGVAPKTPMRSPNDSGNPEVKDTTSEIRGGTTQQIGRSVAIDSSCEGHVLVADTSNRDKGGLHLNNHQFQEASESSKQNRGEHSKSKSVSRVLHCVTTPAMSKSFSGGRLLVVMHEKGRN